MTYYIVDGILVILIAITLFVGWKRGILASLLKLLGTVGSIILSNWVSSQYASLFYEKLVRNGLIENIKEKIASKGDLSGVSEIFNSAVFKILSKLGMISDASMEALRQKVATISDPGKVATTIVDSYLETPVTELCRGALFIVCLLICLILVRVLLKIFIDFNDTPVLGAMNRFLGAVLGLTEGLVICYIVVYVGTIILNATSDGRLMLEELARESIVFSLFHNLKLF